MQHNACLRCFTTEDKVFGGLKTLIRKSDNRHSVDRRSDTDCTNVEIHEDIAMSSFCYWRIQGAGGMA